MSVRRFVSFFLFEIHFRLWNSFLHLHTLDSLRSGQMNGGVKVEDDLSECTSPPLLHGQNTASPIEDKLKEENEREEGATLSPPNTWTEEEQTMTERVADSTQVHDF